MSGMNGVNGISGMMNGMNGRDLRLKCAFKLGLYPTSDLGPFGWRRTTADFLGVTLL